MNRYPADALSADLKAQITSDIQHLIEDSQIGSSVVIRTPTGVAFNAATGSSVLTQAQTTITGTLQALTQREIAGSGGLYQEGDRMLRVLVSPLQQRQIHRSSQGPIPIRSSAQSLMRWEYISFWC